jgi:hypothetical protein
MSGKTGGPAFRLHHDEVGGPSFAAFLRRVGGRLIAQWAGGHTGPARKRTGSQRRPSSNRGCLTSRDFRDGDLPTACGEFSIDYRQASGNKPPTRRCLASRPRRDAKIEARPRSARRYGKLKGLADTPKDVALGDTTGTAFVDSRSERAMSFRNLGPLGLGRSCPNSPDAPGNSN